MNNGWIKLWEETIYHPVWRDDPVAWRIFEYLLISAYRGTPQGTTVKTTQQIADACLGGPGKNGTCYKAIKRLEKHGMVKTKSTNKRTEFKITNWWKYQGNRSAGKNEVKTQQKQSNTLNKNKIKNKENNHSDDFENTLSEYKKMRKVHSKPMTDKAVELLIGKLEKLYPKDETKQIDCMNQSILNGWQSVYELKAEPKVNSRGVMF